MPLDRPRDEIRLLELYPSHDATADIRSAIFHQSLKDPLVRYSALSYIWGESLRHARNILGNPKRPLRMECPCYTESRNGSSQNAIEQQILSVMDRCALYQLMRS